MDRSVVVATVKLGLMSLPCILGRKKLRFEVVCNSHFYNYSMDRSVVMGTVKLVVVNLP